MTAEFQKDREGSAPALTLVINLPRPQRLFPQPFFPLAPESVRADSNRAPAPFLKILSGSRRGPETTSRELETALTASIERLFRDQTLINSSSGGEHKAAFDKLVLTSRNPCGKYLSGTPQSCPNQTSRGPLAFTKHRSLRRLQPRKSPLPVMARNRDLPLVALSQEALDAAALPLLRQDGVAYLGAKELRLSLGQGKVRRSRSLGRFTRRTNQPATVRQNLVPELDPCVRGEACVTAQPIPRTYTNFVAVRRQLMSGPQKYVIRERGRALIRSLLKNRRSGEEQSRVILVPRVMPLLLCGSGPGQQRECSEAADAGSNKA